MLDYIRDGAEIYRRSFAIIRSEADLSAIPADLDKLAVRVAHACGMVDVIADLAFSAGAGAAGRAALAAGCAILCDTAMVAEGVTRSRLSADNAVLALGRDGELDSWAPLVGGSVVAIGTESGVLTQLLARIAGGWPKPALVLGFAVGFDGAAAAKAALAANTLGVAFVVVRGTRGGNAMAAAAINALSTERE